MLPKLIGLNGRKGSGKDTAGAFLVKDYGYERLSFAEPLKDSVAALFGTSVEAIEKYKNSEDARVHLVFGNTPDASAITLTLRYFLQRYGTESHREIFGQDFWVEQALAKIQDGHRYVFTDARFPNELEAIHALGGINVRIERPSLDYGDMHASETEPPAYLINATIDNVGTLDDLHHEVIEVLYDYQLGHLDAIREAGL